MSRSENYDAKIKKLMKKHDAQIKELNEIHNTEMNESDEGKGKENRKNNMMNYEKYKEGRDDNFSIKIDLKLKDKYYDLFTEIRKVTILKKYIRVSIHAPSSSNKYNYSLDDGFSIEYKYDIKAKMHKNTLSIVYSGDINFSMNFKTKESSFSSFSLNSDMTSFSTRSYINALNYLKHLSLLYVYEDE